jgi:hypothetical protein
VLKCGLSSIIDKLVERLQHTEINSGTSVTNINFEKNKVYCYKHNKKRSSLSYNYDNLYISIPPKEIVDNHLIDDNYMEFTKNIVTIPLVRIFASSNKGNVKHPYKVMEDKSDPVQRHVSLTHQFHQVVYASNDNARFWKKKSNKVISDNVHIPVRSSSIKKYYWESGIHLQNYLHNEKVEFSDNLPINIKLIGESYNPYKRWIESAIQSVSV